MKYSFLILSFAFACGVLCSAESAPAKQNASKPAVKNSAAQKNLERENRKAYDAAMRAFQGAMLKSEPQVRAAMDVVIELLKCPGTPGLGGADPFTDTLKRNIRYNRLQTHADNKTIEYGLRGLMKAAPDGDGKVVYMRNLADFLESVKAGAPGEIEALRANSYKVPDVSQIKLMELYASDNDLKKADELADAAVKSTDKEQLPALLNRIIAMFAKKKVFGSAFTKKWMEARNAVLTGDKKAAALTEYADFLDAYAFADDGEIQKIRDSRFQVPDLTPEYRISLMVADIKGSPDEVNAAIGKIFDFCGSNGSLRSTAYWRLIRNPKGNMFELFRDRIFKDPYTYSNERILGSVLDIFTDLSYTNGHYAESEALFQDALKKVAGQPRLESTVRSSLARFYVRRAKRFYDTKDPVLLRKAIDLYRQNCQAIPESNTHARIDCCVKIAECAFDSGDYDLIREQTENIAKILGPEKEKSDRYAQVMRLFGRAALMEGRYGEAASILERYMGSRPSFADIEALVRSLNALKQYDKAYSYRDQMLRLSTSFMRPRYQTMFDELKKRTSAAR